MSIIITGNAPKAEQMAYVDYLEKTYKREIESLDIKIDGDHADLSYRFAPYPPFERIRRITGYLVGTVDHWNDAKRAEESDRIKHSM